MLADPIRVFSSFSCDTPQEMNGKEGGRGGGAVEGVRTQKRPLPYSYVCMYVCAYIDRITSHTDFDPLVPYSIFKIGFGKKPTTGTRQIGFL